MNHFFVPNTYALPSYGDFDWVIYWITNSLSIIGSSILLWIGHRNKESINLSLKFVILLSFSNFIISFVNLLTPVVELDNELCKILGFTKVFAGWTGLFWTSAISLIAYMIIGNMNRLDLSSIFKQITIVSLALSFFTAVLPLFEIGGLTYTVEDGYCAVSYEDGTSLFKKLFVFAVSRGVPYILAVVVTIAAYLRSLVFFRSLPQELVEAYNIKVKRLLLYPTAQLIIYTPTALSTLWIIWMPKIPKSLFIIGTTCYNLCGFINFLVYGGILVHHIRSKSRKSRTMMLSNQESSENIDSLPDSAH